MLTYAATILCAVGAFAALGVNLAHPRPLVRGLAFPVFVALIGMAILLGFGELP